MSRATTDKLKSVLLTRMLPTPLPQQILKRMEVGNADVREIPMLEELTRQIEGHTICALGDAAAWPVRF
jgi:NADH:ubiquinone oxidoreductase subunit F (NADH-binding)